MDNKRRGYIPDGQTSRGTQRFDSANPKDHSARRRDGVIADQGDAGQRQAGSAAQTTGRGTDYGASTFNRGSQASIPDESVVNTNYAETTGSVPQVTNVSAYRSYNVSPVELPSPNGDDRPTPQVPRTKGGDTRD